MQFNKCSRCGCFFVTNDTVCPNCKTKDLYDINRLKEFLENVDNTCSTEEISYNTGISSKNLNRLLNLDDFSSNPKIQL